MRELERKFSKSERIIAKAKFSYWVFLTEFIVAAFLGGIIAVFWIYSREIVGRFTEYTLYIEFMSRQVAQYTLTAAGLGFLLAIILHSLCIYKKELIVTENNLVFKSGVMSVKSIMIPIAEIKIVESKQNIFQRLLGFGVVIIISDAEKPYVMRNIVKPERLARCIIKQTTVIRKKDNMRNVQIQLAPAPNSSQNRGIPIR